MVGHGGSSAGSYLADPTSPIPSHCVSVEVTSTLTVNVYVAGRVLQHVQYSQASCQIIIHHCRALSDMVTFCVYQWLESHPWHAPRTCFPITYLFAWKIARKVYKICVLLVTTIDAQWEGMGDVGSARYKPALLPPCPTIRVLNYNN